MSNYERRDRREHGSRESRHERRKHRRHHRHWHGHGCGFGRGFGCGFGGIIHRVLDKSREITGLSRGMDAPHCQPPFRRPAVSTSRMP